MPAGRTFPICGDGTPLRRRRRAVEERNAIEPKPDRNNVVYKDKLLAVSRTAIPPGLRFVGEIDASNAGAVAQAISQIPAAIVDVHLELTALSFTDVSGIKTIVSASESLGEGRRLLLHGLPAQLARVVSVVGWSEQPNLAICECAGVVE